MNVHELYTALSMQDRAAKVTIKEGKLHVGGKALKIDKADAEEGNGGEGGTEGGQS